MLSFNIVWGWKKRCTIFNNLIEKESWDNGLVRDVTNSHFKGKEKLLYKAIIQPIYGGAISPKELALTRLSTNVQTPVKRNTW